MPTYKVESFTDPEILAEGRSLHVLVCEQCGEVLRGLPEQEGTGGMSAGEVKALWPDLSEKVTRHERDCRALNLP